MRWLLAQILWVPKLILLGLLVFLGYSYFTRMLSGIEAAMHAGIVVAMMVAVDKSQERLLRRRPRFPRVRLPKPSKKATAPPVAAPMTAQASQERRFAPVPLAEAIEHQTSAPTPVLSDRMRAFIERGDRAIHQSGGQNS
ncbi:MAG: hypothetical protein HEP70_18580 [Rhodobiaceae bacterium]|nr:hypothetical protein [Rhodobiaceae bacterium]